MALISAETVVAVPLMLLVAVCSTPQTVLEDVVPMTLARGTQSDVVQPRQVVVRTSADWRSLWAEHSSEPVPPVDFARVLVVGVFLGSRPTAGFDVEVTGVTIRGDEAVVRFAVQRPAADAVLAQIVTSPYHVVLLPAGLRVVRLEQVDSSR